MRWRRSRYTLYSFVTGVSCSGKSFTVELGLQGSGLEVWSPVGPIPPSFWGFCLLGSVGEWLSLLCDAAVSVLQWISLSWDVLAPGPESKERGLSQATNTSCVTFVSAGQLILESEAKSGLKLDYVKPRDMCRDRFIDLPPISKHLRVLIFIRISQSFNWYIRFVFRYHEPFWNSHLTFPSRLELYTLLW